MLWSKCKCKGITATYFDSIIPKNVITFSKLLIKSKTRINIVQGYFKWTHLKKWIETFPNNVDLECRVSLVLKIAWVVKQDELELLVDYTSKVMNSTLFESQLTRFIGFWTTELWSNNYLIEKEYQIGELEIVN
jgi:hypothetical protein